MVVSRRATGAGEIEIREVFNCRRDGVRSRDAPRPGSDLIVDVEWKLGEVAALS